MKRKTLSLISTCLIGSCTPIALVNLSSCQEKNVPIEMTGIAFREDTSHIVYNKDDPFDVISDGKSKIPTIVATFKDGSFKSYFYGDEELTFSGFDSSTIGKKTINVTLNYNTQKFNLSYEIEVFNVVKPVIIRQPTNQAVNYPAGASFSIEVKNPDEVATYKWQYNATSTKDQPESWCDLDGSETNSNTLNIPFTDFTSFTSYRCVVTNKSGASVVSKSADLIIQNKNEFVNCFYVGEHALTVNSNKTTDEIDLAQAGYGDGTITFEYETSEKAKITFDNVTFETKNYKCSSTENFAFSLQQMANTEVKEYDVVFKGTNKITNTLWSEDYNSGGYTFYAGFSYGTEGGATYINPQINFKKGDSNASVTFEGGSAAIFAESLVTCNVNMTLKSPENRLSKGIICHGFTLENGCKIDAELGGAVIFAQFDNEIHIENQGRVYLKENSEIKAVIKPGVVMGGVPTELFVVQGATLVDVNKATIDAEVVIDSKIVTTETKIANFIGVGCMGNTGQTIIRGSSNVKVKAKTINDPPRSERTCSNCYGIAAPQVFIEGSSNVTIDMDSNQFFFAAGIRSTLCRIAENSTVDITMDCFQIYYGIYIDTLILSDILYSKLVIDESDVNVNMKCTYAGTTYVVALEINGEKSQDGEKQSTYAFNFANGSTHKVTLNVGKDQNAYPITYLLEKSCEERPEPKDDYEPIFITQDSDLNHYKISTTEGVEYEINLITNQNNNKWETFYLKKDGQRTKQFVQTLIIGPNS